MIKKLIELDAMFTPYTLDTYSTFTLDNEAERIIENLSEDTGRELSYDDIDWNFDMDGLVKALANRRLKVLRDNILDHVILAIADNTDISSPREYNFKTDNCFNVYTVDIEALDDFIAKNQKDYDNNKLRDRDGFWWFGDDDQTKLNYYLTKTNYCEKGSEFEEYYYDMIEGVDLSEFINYKLIN
jgi:hypothetical protein